MLVQIRYIGDDKNGRHPFINHGFPGSLTPIRLGLDQWEDVYTKDGIRLANYAVRQPWLEVRAVPGQARYDDDLLDPTVPGAMQHGGERAAYTPALREKLREEILAELKVEKKRKE